MKYKCPPTHSVCAGGGSGGRKPGWRVGHGGCAMLRERGVCVVQGHHTGCPALVTGCGTGCGLCQPCPALGRLLELGDCASHRAAPGPFSMVLGQASTALRFENALS